jgi:hypothetical protein
MNRPRRAVGGRWLGPAAAPVRLVARERGGLAPGVAPLPDVRDSCAA